MEVTSVLLIDVILCSSWALLKDGLANRLGDKRLGAYISLTENLLCLEELLKIQTGKSEYTMKIGDLPALDSYTRHLMWTLKDVYLLV